MKKSQYADYPFRQTDPIIMSLGLILTAKRQHLPTLAADSGVSYATLCSIRRTYNGTGNSRYHKRRIYYSTVAAILFHLDMADIMTRPARKRAA